MSEKEPMAEVRLELELGGIHASALEPIPFLPRQPENEATPAPSRTTGPASRVRGGGVSPERATDTRTRSSV
jgi:hypothetical protein